MHNLFSEFHQFEKTCDAKDIKKNCEKSEEKNNKYDYEELSFIA